MWQPLAAADPRLAPLRGLPAGAGARTDALVLEGELVLARARAAGLRPQLLLATPAAASRLDPSVAELAAVMDEAELSAVVGFRFHRGCIAIAPRPAARSLADALAAVAAQPQLRIVALDRLADAANVGAVLRACRALDVALVLMGPGCADPWSRRSLRASMGHALAQPWVAVPSLPQALEHGAAALPELVWWALACDDDATALERAAADPPPRLGLVLGHEGEGVAAEVRQRCDARVGIAMAHGVDSLNVASAAAIALWAVQPCQGARPR
jgi:tRNA G18 (ribose-2'-O)-methylase SpoU